MKADEKLVISIATKKISAELLSILGSSNIMRNDSLCISISSLILKIAIENLRLLSSRS